MKAFSALLLPSLNSLNFLLLAALLVQFSTIGGQALFMEYYDIPFTWRPLYLQDVSTNMECWGFTKLYFVYAGIPILFFIAGLYLSFFLSTNIALNWRARLFLTWVSFFMVNAMLAGIIVSLFIFDGIGVALIWIFPGFLVRLILGIFAATILLFTRPYWENLFFKSIYSKSFLRDSKSKQQFLKNNFKLPLFLMIPSLILFAYLSSKWYWPLSVIITIIIAYGFNNLQQIPSRIRILKENKRTFSLTQQLLTHFIILILWFLSAF